MEPASTTTTIPRRWTKRILIVGRIGSGRKAQATLLAAEFGLNLIDLDYLLGEYDGNQQQSQLEQQKPSLVAKNRLSFWGFLQERLLLLHCLHNGWVIVSTVISRAALEIPFLQPNRIIFIHTSETECRRRLTQGICLPSSYRFDNINTTYDGAEGEQRARNVFLNYQMVLYNLHKKEFVELRQQLPPDFPHQRQRQNGS